MAIDDDEEKAILEQLPNIVEEKLYFCFLHLDFLMGFKKIFFIQK